MPKKLRDLKRIRAEILSIRTDPKLLMATRLAAFRERRTVSSFVEWAIERAVKSVNVSIDEAGKPVDALAIVEHIWDDDEVKRFIYFALNYEDLLTNEERALWDLIWFDTAFSKPRPTGPTKSSDLPQPNKRGKSFVIFDPMAFVKLDTVREHWETLKAVAAEKQPRSALPKGETINESKLSLRKERERG